MERKSSKQLFHCCKSVKAKIIQILSKEEKEDLREDTHAEYHALNRYYDRYTNRIDELWDSERYEAYEIYREPFIRILSMQKWFIWDVLLQYEVNGKTFNQHYRFKSSGSKLKHDYLYINVDIVNPAVIISHSEKRDYFNILLIASFLGVCGVIAVVILGLV